MPDMNSGTELNCTGQCKMGCCFEVASNRLDQLIRRNVDCDEHIETGNLCQTHWDQTAVSVMNEEITTECLGREIIHAASTVRHITQDETIIEVGKLPEDVGDNTGIHQ